MGGGGGGGEDDWEKDRDQWWQDKALSALGKEITPSFECTLTHTYNEWLLLTRAGNLQPSVSAENCQDTKIRLHTR